MMRMAPHSLIVIILCLLKVAKVQGDCPTPYLGENRVLTESSIKDSYPDGTKVTFQCTSGFVTVDTKASRSIICTGKEWTKLELQCKKKTCGSLEALINGYYDMTEGVLFGATVTAHCKAGYNLVGQTTRICQESGWDGRAPFCDVVKCKSPPAIENGDFEPKLELYRYEDAVTYSCMDKFILIGEKTLVCSSHGTFESPPVCQKVSCDLPRIVNAIRTEGKRPPYEYLDYIKFECEVGYRMSGSAKLVCLETGWDQPLPSCTKSCEALIINHGHITDKYPSPYEYNGYIQYKCNKGYLITGPDTLQCTQDGWNPHPPHCRNIWLYIVIALVVLLVLAIILFFCYKRQKRSKQQYSGKVSTVNEDGEL